MAADTSYTLEGPLAKRGGRQAYESLVLTTEDGAVQRIRRGTTVLVNGRRARCGATRARRWSRAGRGSRLAGRALTRPMRGCFRKRSFEQRGRLAGRVAVCCLRARDFLGQARCRSGAVGLLARACSGCNRRTGLRAQVWRLRRGACALRSRARAQDVPTARIPAQARLQRDVGQRRDVGGAQRRSPRIMRLSNSGAVTPRAPQLFFSSHADNIPADSLVHCAVVRFLLTPPAPDAQRKGAGFFAARVYEPSTGAVHTLESGNFAEPFASEVRFIFEGPGRQRSAAAGASLPSDESVPLKPAKTPASPKAAPGTKGASSPLAETASPSPAPPAVVQKPRGAPPPPPATVAATLREALRREETQAGRVRLLNQVVSTSDEVRAALDVKEAAAHIASWINLALRRGPPAGTEAANALLSAAIKALAALQLPRPALVGPKGKPVVDAVRLAARSATVAPAVRGAAAALAARWQAVISSVPEGGAAPAPAEGDEFFASPRSTEAAVTLTAVARRPGGSGGAKTPLAASNGGGSGAALQPAKPTPAGKRAAPVVAADDDDDAPPPAKRAKGATQLAAAAAEAHAEAAAARAVFGSAAAFARAPLAQSKKRSIQESVANALTAVTLALQLSRAARAAIAAAAAGDDDEDADDAGALIQARLRWDA